MPPKSLRHEHCLFTYGARTIPYDIWTKTRDGSVDTIIFLGTVQIGKAVEWIAEIAPPHTAVVQGAPHWYTKEDGSDVPQFTLAFTESAFHTIKQKYTINNLHIIAESQAAPAVITLSGQKDSPVSTLKQLTLLQPLGLNWQSYGTSDTKRTSTLRRRTLRNAVHQLIPLMHDKRLRHNHRTLARYVNFRSQSEQARYANGLKYNASKPLQLLWQKYPHKITIVIGGYDRLFPASEIMSTLRRLQLPIPVTIIPRIPHSPLATKQGQKLLMAALEQPRS